MSEVARKEDQGEEELNDLRERHRKIPANVRAQIGRPIGMERIRLLGRDIVIGKDHA